VIRASVALLVLAASADAWAQPKKDRVVKRDRSVVEGQVKQDKFSGVVVDGQTIPADQVLRVEYYDAPPSFLSAFAAMDETKWEDAVSGIKAAYDRVYTGPDRERLKVRSWFELYHLFYLGYCDRQLGRFDDALRRFASVREMKDKNPKEPSRMWADAFELSLECLRERGKAEDLDEMTKLIASIDAAPQELQAGLRKRAQKQQAELLFDNKAYDKAKDLFDSLRRESDPALRADGTTGVIKCLEEMKRPAELKSFCEQVLRDESFSMGVRLVSSNALARSLQDAKDFRGALRQLIESVVRLHPGRGSGYDRDHEEALFQLGVCYRRLGADSKDAPAKRFYFESAASALREAALTYPSGRRRDEALKMADQADQEAAKSK